MSEARNDFGRKSITPKTKKLHPRVDLTAMVSVSFLLIVFFMLTSFLSRSNAMDLSLPDNNRISCYGYDDGYGDNRVITLLLDDNDRIVSYIGYAALPLEDPKVLSYGKNDIRKELLRLKQAMAINDNRDDRIVVIKPSKQSSYKNLVDIMDEMAITQVPTYTIINDFMPEELELLKQQ